MAARKTLCPDCRLPVAECLGHEYDELDETLSADWYGEPYAGRAIGLLLTGVICPRCGASVQVDGESPAGTDVDEMTAAAQTQARLACPAHDEPVRVR